MHRLVFLLLLLFPSLILQAQKSIHLKKQKTNFLFACINTQVKGENMFQEEQSWYFNNTNVKNLFMLRYEHKNRKVLQLGYVKKFALKNWSFLLNTESQADSEIGKMEFEKLMPLNFRLNLVFNFITKWDRTSISIGTKNIKYGHNPKIDGFFNFTPTLARLDLGLNRDVGVFAHFPISSKLDFDGSLTLGGFLNAPFIKTTSSSIQDGFGLQLQSTPYKGTFLLTSRIGSPSHSRQEVGVFSAVGNIVDPKNAASTAFVTKLGGEYIFKFSDHLLFLQQASIGMYHPNDPLAKAQLRSQFMTGIDYTFRGWFVLALNNAFLFQKEKTEGISSNYGLLTGTAGFVLNPNLQARINVKRNYLEEGIPPTTNFLFQVILGLGQRP